MKILQTKNLQARILELESGRDTWIAELTPEEKEKIAKAFDLSLEELTAQDILDEWENSSDGDELKNLIELREDIGEYHWKINVSLISESDFEEFAQQEADSMGYDTDNWPANHIDWRRAAEELKYGYARATYDMETYYYQQ